VGENTGSDEILQTLNNSNAIVSIQGLTPDVNRRITVRMDGLRANGTPHLPSVNDDARGLINFLQLTEHFANPIGDFNRNGTVNADDYIRWRSTFGSSRNLTADGNKNGVVDAGDYVVWRNAMTEAASGGYGSALAVIPEPAAGLLTMIGHSAFCIRRRVRRR
jgi:hypothetical protein